MTMTGADTLTLDELRQIVAAVEKMEASDE